MSPATEQACAMRSVGFVKEAGEALFHPEDAEAAAARALASPFDATLLAASASANVLAAAAIEMHLAAQGLVAARLIVAFDAASGVASVSGAAATQALHEKILLCVGNVRGVAQVEDRMTLVEPAAAPRWHLVTGGDTLPAIAKAVYGNPTQYMKIFVANRPMLGHPEGIYPGQLLRLPANPVIDRTHRARGQAPRSAAGRP